MDQINEFLNNPEIKVSITPATFLNMGLTVVICFALVLLIKKALA